MEINQLTAELTNKIGYKPSKYQIGILEWVLNGSGHGACNAVAGAGKSSTLRMVAIALELVGFSPRDIRVIVFGKENSKELINKFGVRWKASISTLHSAGFSLLKKELDIKDNRDIQLSDGKYKRIAQDLDLIGKRGSRGKLHEDGAVGKDSEFLRLVNLMRLTNNYPTAEIVRELCHHFEVEDIYEYSIVAEAIADCLRIGEQKARNKDIIDFTDQVWLPVKWEIYKRRWFKPYKFVLVDECQDLNATQLELAIGLTGSEGRLLFVGDPHQAIFGFAGADNRSYQKILSRTKATELPLSTCYRCPRSHIDLVRWQFPKIPIEANPDANFGEIQQLEEKDLEQHLRVGDRVISRKTAPLVSQCIKLIARGIAATVKGRDIGESIKRDLEEIASMPGFKYENFHSSLNEYRSLKALKYKEMDNEEQLIQNLNDKLEALQTIYISQPQAKRVADLSSYIDSLFSDDHSSVTLSTCHRAKGLEGDRIFILKPEDMPMTWRNQLEWQKEQEDNLLYVALTRSKSELFVVGQPDWLPQEKTEEDSRSDTAITSPPDLKPNLNLELETPEDDVGVEDYSNWMPELAPEDAYLPTEAEIYAEIERAAEENLLPELQDTSSTIDQRNPKELPLSTARTQSPSAATADWETVNRLQSEGTETFATLLKPVEEVINSSSKQWIDPRLITLNAGTQTRKETNQSKIDEYALAMREGLWDWNREPPVIFQEGENYYPGEGHHRIPAALAAQVEQIRIELRPGTLRDAQFFSCGANKFHGLPRTNADKRNQVELLLQDAEWQQMSDRAIAQHCGVSAPFVGKVRSELEAAGTVNVSPTRVDRKGRKIDTANIGIKPRIGAGGSQTLLESVKQSQAGVEQQEQQPLETETHDSTVSLNAPTVITQLQLQEQSQPPNKAEDALLANSNALKSFQAKLRIEGETKEDIDAIALLLQQTFDVIEESEDYHNRKGTGRRRYLTVRVTSYESISFP